MVHSKTFSAIKESPHVLQSLPTPPSSCPSFVVMIGRAKKSAMLQQLLRGGDHHFLDQPHGQVHLWKDPSAIESVFIDSELHSHDVPQWTFVDYDSPEVMRTAYWLDRTDGPFTRTRVGHLISGRVLSPIADVLCYFAADLGGTKAVAALLAAHIRLPPPSDTPDNCLPRVLIVVETASKNFDCAVAEGILLDTILQKFDSDTQSDLRSRLRRHFSQIRVVGLSKGIPTRETCIAFNKCLQTLRRDVSTARKLHGYLFIREHAHNFLSRLLDHFCAGYDRTFSFVLSSRPVDFSLTDFPAHLLELFTILPSQSWLWHLACPLIASSVILSSYPPSSHGMPLCALSVLS